MNTKQKQKNDIIFSSPNDGLIVKSNHEIWIHIIDSERWTELSNEFTKSNLHLGSQIFYDIKDGDVVLIYVKMTQSKIKSGFVAIVQTCSDIEKNTKKIKLYADKNVNKFIVELEAVVLLSEPMNQSEFKDIVSKYSHIFKNMSRFSSIMLKFTSVGNFVLFPDNKMGVEFIDHIIQKQEIEEIDSADDDDDDDGDDDDDDDDDEIVSEDTEIEEINTKNNVDSDSDLDESEDLNTEIIKQSNCEDEDMNFEVETIIPNVPIMMIVCDDLRRIFKRIKLAKTKIQTVMDHYMYCRKCDITNNNKSELMMTYLTIDKNTIRFCENRHEQPLTAYLSNIPYPNNVNREYIKIYHMSNDVYYTRDILIEYSTRMIPIFEISEQKVKKN